ncbi:MAG: radical SAM protein [Planctomycetaceae bacterium]|jgi:MoaA/NifB/PqqE/SkfB family radical SAM enzyme|nr:radical SAM protein [Planctomycetaceae bacterium]
MKAVIKYRVNTEEHVLLGEVAPLNQPYVLLIDPCNRCNFRCKFCPTGNHQLIKSTGRFQGILDFDLFKKIIDDLKEFDEPIRVLRLYKEGEPLLNKNFSHMVKYAKQSGLVKKIDTTTNGSLLNPELNRKIIDAGLGQINISVNGVNTDQIYYYTGVRIDFDKYVANIRDLYENRGNCEISIKAIKENLTDEEQKQFFDIFGDISNRIVLENLSPAWPQFQFHEDIKMEFCCGNYGQEIIPRQICPYIFYIMVINTSGKVSTCVGDWPNRLIMGNIKTQSVKDVWLGRVLNDLRINHLKGHRSDCTFCRDCEVVTHGTLDNMDDYADKILFRMGVQT